ncbi:hypothetical protein [Paractinoplanes toevensis]|uniref:Uncharacterized protein n=1 Tax=Paractinoplanes toevensis TaxID=571911 RepID=A0A919T640_9ACTN|nr:hypothetical protein [Actinoplanes toevensis]GIM88454.1 hypothetical protein Ato02nite_002470 [Actinoplanes toevensis]
MRTAVITILAGGLTYLITDLLNQDPSLRLMLSVLVGGVVLLAQFLVAFEHRLTAVERAGTDGMARIERLVGHAFAEFSEATALFGLIEASALQTDLVTQFVRNSTQISPESPPIVYQFVQAKIKETSEFVKQLSEGGTVTYYGEDREWLLGLTSTATTSIDAISLAAADYDLWQSQLGQRYLDAQGRAARDGKRVRRIFVIDEPSRADDPMLRRVCVEQLEADIEVRLLVLDRVPPRLQGRMRDLVIFDDVLAYETTATTGALGRAQVAETRMVLTSSRVKECILLFMELWDMAHVPPHRTD